MPRDLHRQYNVASYATIIGIVVMVLLAVVKVGVGWWGRSAALVADGIHTVSDVGSSLVVLLGLAIAQRPPDRTHPYGHGRAEGVASRLVAFGLILVVMAIVHGALGQLSARERTSSPSPVVPFFAGISIVVNELLYQYKHRVSRETGSQAVLADAWHHRSDVFTSIPVLGATAVAAYKGGDWALLDPIAALVVAAVILGAAIGIVKGALPEMMDAALEPGTTQRLRQTALQVAGVKDIEAIRGRRSGLGVLVELHVEVDPQATVEQGHEVARRVRDALFSMGENVTDAVIHVEPYYPNDH